MRWRSFHATLTAAAVLLGSGAVSRAEPDAFFADLDKTGMAKPAVLPSAVASTTLAAVRQNDAARRHVDAKADELATASGSTRRDAPADPHGIDALLDDGPAGKPFDSRPLDSKPLDSKPLDTKLIPGAAPVVKAKADDKSLDPEPDVAIKPPAASPSRDLLDALTPPAVKPTAGGADPAKAAPSNNDPSKAANQGEDLPVLNAAIKAALDKRDKNEIRGAYAGERRKEREAIAFLYAAHGFAPLWSENDAPVAAVASVLERLAAAGDDALTLASVPTSLKTTGTPDVIADSDIALTEAVVSYARQATGSRVDPVTISPLIGVKRALADPAEIVDSIAGAGFGAGDTLQALNPIDPRYVALREKLVEQHGAHAAASAVHAPITPGPTLRVGMRDPRVPLVRARFGLSAAASGPDDLVYDAEVAEAVADFQRGNGLTPSGALTKRTVEALSGGPRPARIDGTLVANMEMWRWMPRELGADRIEVNIPDFMVTVFHEGQPVSQNRVVVGKIDTPTPLFSNTMTYLIVNPYWNVPQSIIRNEMMPKGRGSLSYLNGRGFSVSSHNGMPVVKQLPGPKNALGQIKFLFPNDYSVYLHDTPSKPLFSAAKRAFSHGCVRVDKPFTFAESVLNDGRTDGRKGWSQERLQKMIGDKEHYVNLPTPLPIHIEYFTASVEAGKVKTRDDIYGYANAVAAALGQGSEPTTIAGRVKPKPVVTERTRRPAKTAEASPAPSAGGSFWQIFDPR